VASSQPYVLHHSLNINQLNENDQAILDDAGAMSILISKWLAAMLLGLRKLFEE